MAEGMKTLMATMHTTMDMVVRIMAPRQLMILPK